jgi:exodeoxyribonuclease VII small subunit
MLGRMDEGNGSGSQQPPVEKMSFEQALAALEEIVQQLERGDVPLDRSIELYERGERLRAACQQRLDTAQARIEKIVADADGRPTGTAPLDGGN